MIARQKSPPTDTVTSPLSLLTNTVRPKRGRAGTEPDRDDKVACQIRSHLLDTLPPPLRPFIGYGKAATKAEVGPDRNAMIARQMKATSEQERHQPLKPFNR